MMSQMISAVALVHLNSIRNEMASNQQNVPIATRAQSMTTVSVPRKGFPKLSGLHEQMSDSAVIAVVAI